MRSNFTGFLSETPRELVPGAGESGKKKSWLGIVPSQLIPSPHQPLLSHDDGAYGVGALGGCCSSTAAQRSSRCDSTDTRRNSCMGNSRNSPDTRNSCIGTPGNRIRFLLLRLLPKPERQLVLPEAEPVRLLPMEVKEVFS